MNIKVEILAVGIVASIPVFAVVGQLSNALHWARQHLTWDGRVEARRLKSA